jgi:sugar phosphate isomerase/epimerase
MASELTILTSMADADFERALARHRLWGLNRLDLKDSIYGCTVEQLDAETARRARDAIDAAGLDVHCLSTSLMHDDLARGEAHFREQHIARIAGMAAAVRILRPKYFRLLAGRLIDKRPGGSAFATVMREHPWVVAAYREAVDRAAELGAAVTIENEARDCMLVTAEDMVAFFAALDRPGKVGLTWDIQNQWTSGSFPRLADYEKLKPLIQYVHVKGGRYDDPATRLLAWKSRLEDASWPVIDIVQKVVDDGVSPVICINPSKGKLRPDYPYDYSDVTGIDIAFLRRAIRGIV